MGVRWTLATPVEFAKSFSLDFRCPFTYTAIYPRGFDKVIKKDFDTLVQELREWRDSAKALAAS